VDDEEVISDSRRIIQYLDWRYGEEIPAAARASSRSE
jgi:glutathione S-transferase